MTDANLPDPLDPDAAGKIDRLAKTAHQAVDQVADKVEPAREKLHEGVDQAASAVKARADRLDRLQDQWLASARSCVREHPIASVVSAVALGMLVQKIMSPR